MEEGRKGGKEGRMIEGRKEEKEEGSEGERGKNELMKGGREGKNE